ncbi:MAG: TIGR00730 family Rossman fold protein [Rhodobacterales bacterium]|nr:MAG: TIGR00730 family Rossman fold protein [Rhodobacterales bacterium]
MTQRTKSICVFCGARSGTNPTYLSHAEELGEAIARAGWRLVYGAGDVGLMGAVANSAQAAGGETFGVIPAHLMQAEQGKRDLSAFVVTENMHERKKVMFMNSDAIVLLPGGAGSLDEFFEVLTWRQLGLHTKPIILINSNGYWNPLADLLNHVITEGFAEASLHDFITLAPDIPAAVARLRTALS